jgi:DNA-binding HxlR family transcriptional regulator
MGRGYDGYCAIAHALGVVGERWSLLVVRELQNGPLRYTDLHARLPGCSTNILAARLKELESGGVVGREKLPPPAAATVYTLTPSGEALQPVLRELAWWAVGRLGPPPADTVFDDEELVHVLRTAVPTGATPAPIEIHVGDAIARIGPDGALPGPAEAAVATITADPCSLYALFVEHALDRVEIQGDETAVVELLDGLPRPGAVPASS